ncbi:rhodanese-like domain-containing protein [Brachybacterium sp. AOP43-C2-M15]|uniref:rhodanese-like domain-containing protein n=1 Tax=Brachybacterium sp. AOP43-C2-M15 TaxID=3457661 RepID=UPI004034BC37
MSEADGSHGRRRAEAAPAHGIEEILEASRRGIQRIAPQDLAAAQAQGAHVIDIRSAATREPEGHIPGAAVIERLVLEWRLDPAGDHRMPESPERDELVVVVCNEGYYSSLAARDLRDLGFRRATDIVGGFRAYARAGLPTDTEPTRTVL